MKARSRHGESGLGTLCFADIDAPIDIGDVTTENASLIETAEAQMTWVAITCNFGKVLPRRGALQHVTRRACVRRRGRSTYDKTASARRCGAAHRHNELLVRNGSPRPCVERFWVDRWCAVVDGRCDRRSPRRGMS